MVTIESRGTLHVIKYQHTPQYCLWGSHTVSGSVLMMTQDGIFPAGVLCKDCLLELATKCEGGSFQVQTDTIVPLNPIPTNVMRQVQTAVRREKRRPWKRKDIQGSKSHLAKLDEPKVKKIKWRIGRGEDISLLALEYGVSKACINDILRSKTWVHVS